MKRTFFLFLAVLVLLFASLPAAAQKFQPKPIQFKGAPEYSDQELLATAGLKTGTVLAFADMKDHSQKLMDTGVFDTLNFKFDGVDLVYTLVPSTTLYPVRLENLPLTPGRELDAALHDRFPLYHGKVPTEGGLMEQVRQAFEEMLAAKGIKATVAVATYADLKLHKVTAVTYSITAPPVRVGAIHLEGVSAAMQDNVKRVADHETGTPFDTENSERNLEHALELFYGDAGYAAVKVHATRSGDAVVTAEAIGIPFSITVEEGQLYKLGTVHLPSNALVTQAEIDKIVGPNARGPAKGQTLRTTWFLIASRYKSKGYLDCTVTPHPEFDEASGTVNYTVEVEPGPVYHLAFVKFENVSDELRSRLMRVWQMLPGDPFDESYVSNFIYEAQKEDPVLMRSLAGVKVTFNVLADPQTHEVNCVMHFTRAQQTP
jgi:outer membrane protein insertion porin family